MNLFKKRTFCQWLTMRPKQLIPWCDAKKYISTDPLKNGWIMVLYASKEN